MRRCTAFIRGLFNFAGIYEHNSQYDGTIRTILNFFSCFVNLLLLMLLLLLLLLLFEIGSKGHQMREIVKERCDNLWRIFKG